MERPSCCFSQKAVVMAHSKFAFYRENCLNCDVFQTQWRTSRCLSRLLPCSNIGKSSVKWTFVNCSVQQSIYIVETSQFFKCIPFQAEALAIPTSARLDRISEFLRFGPVTFDTLVLHTGSGDIVPLSTYFNR